MILSIVYDGLNTYTHVERTLNSSATMGKNVQSTHTMDEYSIFIKVLQLLS